MKRIFATVMLFVFALPSYGQLWDKFTNPKVRVTLTHPPGSGVKVEKIAFALQRASDCGEHLVDALTINFTNAGMEVIERRKLDAILDEHNLNLTQFADPQGRGRMGKLLGPAAVVLLNVHRCQADPPQRFQGKSIAGALLGGKGVAYTTRTTYILKGSTRIIDLATGKILVMRTFDGSTSKEVTSYDQCCPEPPSEYEVQEAAIQKATESIHRLFFPWAEERELYFFDDEPCGLKTAFRLLKAGDHRGALSQSETNAASCESGPRVKPKVVWHALYNVGMANFIIGEYDKAMEFFTRAASAGGGDIVTASLADCRNAKQLAEEMRRVDERPSLDDLQVASQTMAVKTRLATPAAKSAASTDPPPTKRAQPDLERRLKKLKALYEQGVISKQEYEKKKNEVLKDL